MANVSKCVCGPGFDKPLNQGHLQNQAECAIPNFHKNVMWQRRQYDYFGWKEALT